MTVQGKFGYGASVSRFNGSNAVCGQRIVVLEGDDRVGRSIHPIGPQATVQPPRALLEFLWVGVKVPMDQGGGPCHVKPDLASGGAHDHRVAVWEMRVFLAFSQNLSGAARAFSWRLAGQGMHIEFDALGKVGSNPPLLALDEGVYGSLVFGEDHHAPGFQAVGVWVRLFFVLSKIRVDEVHKCSDAGIVQFVHLRRRVELRTKHPRVDIAVAWRANASSLDGRVLQGVPAAGTKQALPVGVQFVQHERGLSKRVRGQRVRKPARFIAAGPELCGFGVIVSEQVLSRGEKKMSPVGVKFAAPAEHRRWA